MFEILRDINKLFDFRIFLKYLILLESQVIVNGVVRNFSKLDGVGNSSKSY